MIKSLPETFKGTRSSFESRTPEWQRYSHIGWITLFRIEARTNYSAGNVQSGVFDMTKGAPEIEYRGDKRRKIIVVLDRLDVDGSSDPKGSFVLVCGVSNIERHYGEYAPTDRSAELALATVHHDDLVHFIEDPHDLHNPDRLDVTREQPIETNPPFRLKSNLDQSTAYRDGLVQAFELSTTYEAILEARDNLNLNRHLYKH